MPLRRPQGAVPGIPLGIPLGATLALALLAAACQAPRPSGPAAATADPVAYLCGGERQVEVLAEDGARLSLRLADGSLRELERVRSASGARYRAEGLEFWSEDAEARLTEGDTTWACRTAAVPAQPVERLEVGAAHPLTGTRWRVSRLDGAGPLPADPRAEGVPTLSFDDSARLSGSGGCNGYRATWERVGPQGRGGLSIGQAASTRRACAPPLLQRETAFFELLHAVARYRLRDDGTLVLETATGRSLTARPAQG
jgi:heat shock protein HslJ/membrane-bound inhibitor of C-type lysozyme